MPSDGNTSFPEPIAIVGMGGVFPGAGSLDQFWQIVEQGRDTSRPVPSGRWPLDTASVLSAAPGATDAVLTDRGCFVDDPALAGELDPVFQLLLLAGKSAFEDCRSERLDRSKVGIILGNIALPTTGASALADEILLPLFDLKVFGTTHRHGALKTNALNRYVTGLPAGRLAKSLGVGGACYTIDAACASSLYAVKLACDELLAHRATAMLAGGLSRPDSFYTQMGFSQLRALSRTGRCAPFDHKGDGLVVGEGAGVVMLKRLADALRDGDSIHGLIRGAGLSNDLEGNLLAPSSEGQLRALRTAYAQARWTPQMVDLIECHATGTPLGDSIEFTSLTKLWDSVEWTSGQCVLSAVKSNIGHLLTAAGGAGLIKTLLAMRHGTLPPVANFERPADSIPLTDSPFSILQKSRPWARRATGVPRRAAVNGFGFGGINAHLLIEEWLGDGETPPATRSGRSPPKRPAAAAVAVVGMGTHVGPWRNLAAFRDRVLRRESPAEAARQATERPSWRGLGVEEIRAVWGRTFPGFYIDDLSVPIDRFRIAPREMAELLPQQLLMLDVAKSALEDAGDPELEPSRSGVFIGLGLDLRTTDFHFRWTMKKRAAAWAQRAGFEAGTTGSREWIDRLCDGAG
ncbi:MAG: beta-ketoacyl synthase N-terminal-like domain-containing protein, partial [Proteobacteria bacterium]|nr:beta-ketoacyl synthase N-terminal-like domain-containing protein [Pseudomonadota bacterium]